MQKHFYKSVIISASLIAVSLFANNNITAVIPTSKEGEANYVKEVVNSLPDNVKKMLTEINGTNMSEIKQAQDDKALEYMLNALPPEKKAEMMKQVEQYRQNDKQIDTFFYFYSESMPFNAVDNYFAKFNRLKKKYPDIVGYTVINGFPNGSIYTFMNNFNREDFGKGALKIHPILFETYGLTRVPAFGLASCPKEFDSKKCDFKYVLRGDVSFDFFLEKIAEENKSYKKYYDYMREAQ